MVELKVLEKLGGSGEELHNLVNAIINSERDMKKAVSKYMVLCGWMNGNIEFVVKDGQIVKIWKTDKVSI